MCNGCSTIPSCKAITVEFYESAGPTDKVVPPIVVGRYGRVFTKIHEDNTFTVLCIDIGDVPCIEPGDMESVCTLRDGSTLRYGSERITLDMLKEGSKI